MPHNPLPCVVFLPWDCQFSFSSSSFFSSFIAVHLDWVQSIQICFSVQFNFCVIHFFYKRPLFFSFLLIISAYLSSLCHLCLPICVTTVCRFDLFTVCAFDFKQCQNNLLPPYVLGILVYTYITFIVDIIITFIVDIII